MGKKLPTTPRSKVKNALRNLWLRSRERALRLKMDNYCCQSCGVKQSKAKGKEQRVEVHHRQGIGNWREVEDVVYKEILCKPEHLETLCPECHIKKGGE